MTHIEIIHGSDSLLIEEKITGVLKLIPPAFREFCYLKYYGHEVVGEDILSEVATLPFGCEQKLVVVKEYQDIKNKNLVERLVTECADSCFLILTSKQLKTLSTKLNKIVSQSKSKMKFYRITNPSVIDLKNRISNYLTKHNFEFEENAVTYLARGLHHQPEFLKGELEKIHLFLLNNKNKLTLHDAQNLSSTQDEHTVFEIVTDILTKKKIKAFKSLNFYLKNSENFILLQVILQTQILKLVQYIEMKALGENEGDIFAELKIPNWGNKRQEMKQMAELTSISQTRFLLVAACELEQILKTQSVISEERDKAKVNLLGRHLLLKMISIYCQ